MKFGVAAPGMILYPPVASDWERDIDPADILKVARKADELGFEWLTIPEHIVMPNEMAETMGPRYPEAMGAAAFLAGATSRIRMLSYVLVLPYRNPVLLAKQIATVDFLSGGRITLGAAAGHLEKEFEVLNIPFHERGAQTDEFLRAMIELWTSDSPSFDGKYFQFDDIVFEPKPTQKPHPPILVGGNSRPAMRRAAALGDGWMPWLVTRDKLREHLEYLQEQPGFAERSRPFEVVTPLVVLNVEDYSHKELGRAKGPRTKEEVIEEIGLWAEAGVTGVLVGPGRTKSADHFIGWMEWFAAEAMSAAG
ncbi:MAG: TIGR03619 family F420-dependent LLM class oxidoreductase [Dehalococcoidia bacterium]